MKARAQFNYAVALLRLGRWQAAGERLRTAIRIEPNFGEAHANYAAVLYAAGQYHGAWLEVQRARELGVAARTALVSALERQMSEPR
jgi:Tfp pilus assembly protein PilF